MIIGVGTDIVENSRVNSKIAKRVLTEREYNIYMAKHDDLKTEYLASRFAAKEAIVKATNKQYTINQIEILNQADGKPYSNIEGIELSISHENNYSVAFAIYQKKV
ncbi:holo-ACP synthase [Mollicutes bacterium LVI A0078]|nr:holo-ACP synthase [Mollicutes bacterium LVI A0075]WOO90637.1 holo-ACP synthase [Mollicutes bacterium LVI A0078]